MDLEIRNRRENIRSDIIYSVSLIIEKINFSFSFIKSVRFEQIIGSSCSDSSKTYRNFFFFFFAKNDDDYIRYLSYIYTKSYPLSS